MEKNGPELSPKLGSFDSSFRAGRVGLPSNFYRFVSFGRAKAIDNAPGLFPCSTSSRVVRGIDIEENEDMMGDKGDETIVPGTLGD